MFCPFNIAAVNLAPHTVAGFSWGPVVRPNNDPCVSAIAVDPDDDSAWFVGGLNGLYMTKNAGQSWTKPLNGPVGRIHLVRVGPGLRPLVYVGVASRLYLSRDGGATWNVLRSFGPGLRVGAILVAGQVLHVSLYWSSHAQPSGVFTSNLGGGVWTFHPFGPGHTGLIVWTLARDGQDGSLYAGAEIFDHPQGSKPPFLRSSDGGVTWTDVSGTLPWHVIAADVRPGDGYVYALTEGAGFFGSADKGATWVPPPVPAPGPTVSLLRHPLAPLRLFGGQQRYLTLSGGAYQSFDGGSSFQPIGLSGVTVAGLAVNGAGTRLYAVAYSSGVYTADIPPAP